MTNYPCYRSGLKLRQLTDGRHLVQVIYTPDGVIQDCEYITEGKTVRNFLKTLRKELKLALDEESYRLTEGRRNDYEDEKFYRHYRNVTFRLLKDGEQLPLDVGNWLNYDRLKTECFERHEELTYMMENRNKVSDTSLTRLVFDGIIIQYLCAFYKKIKLTMTYFFICVHQQRPLSHYAPYLNSQSLRSFLK